MLNMELTSYGFDETLKEIINDLESVLGRNYSKKQKSLPYEARIYFLLFFELFSVLDHLGDTHIDGAEICLEFFFCHLENLDTLDDTHDTVNGSHNTEGYAGKNYSDNACFGLTLNEAGNAVCIEQNGKNTEKCLVHNMYSLK